MDVKLTMRSAQYRSSLFSFLLPRCLVLLLSPALVTTAAATEIVFASDDAAIGTEVADAEESSTIFFADATPSAPPQLPLASGAKFTAPQSADGSIVFVDDAALGSPAGLANSAASPRTDFAPVQPASRGDLKVVANHGQHTNLTALPPLAATVEASGDTQVAVHAAPVLAPAQGRRVPPRLAAATSAGELLIGAHQLALEADSANDYTQISDACAQAIHLGIALDQQRFASNLASWSLNRRGQMLLERGDNAQAKADFDAAIQHSSRNWRALHNRGVSYAQTGNFAEAFDDFNAVLQINPQHAKAYTNRATLYVQAKDLQAAIKDYEQAIAVDSKFATAYVGLGRVCHMLGRWEDALAHFTTAVKLEPASPDVLCSRGDLQADMGRYGDALADYARTIEIAPEFAHAYRNGAWLLATCPDKQYRDPQNAVLGAEQALEYSYGERHVALDTLAAALASNGQYQAAVDAVTQAVDLAPENAKFTYLARRQLYQENQPFRTEPIGDVSQVTYEASDQE